MPPCYLMNDKLYEDGTWPAGTPTFAVSRDVKKLMTLLFFNDIIKF